MKLINKDAVMAEIEKRLEELYKLLPDASKVENGIINVSEACNTGKYTALESFKDYIDTLGVKEVKEPENDELEVYIKERIKSIPTVLRSGFHQLCRQLIKDGANWQKRVLVKWLKTESDFLFKELHEGNGDLAKQYRAELYKEIIAKLKGV